MYFCGYLQIWGTSLCFFSHAVQSFQPGEKNSPKILLKVQNYCDHHAHDVCMQTSDKQLLRGPRQAS